jgi:1,4-alpha-glucan branching enzyme
MPFPVRPLVCLAIVTTCLSLAPTEIRAASNDNNVEWAGISHLTVSDRSPVCPVLGETFTVQIRAWAGDLSAASVEWTSNSSSGAATASVTSSVGPYDFWEAIIPATSAGDTIRYYFSLIDGTDSDYFSEVGMSVSVPILSQQFDVDFVTLSHAPYGATVHPTAGTVFRVWAQGSATAHVRGEFNGWGLGNPMSQVGEDFIALVPGAAVNQRYKFFFDNVIWNTDARARSVDAGDNYNAITQDATLFPWTSSDYQTPPLEEMVIYQLHVGTFAGRNDPLGATAFPSTYRNVADRVAHLSDLGVNAVMLNPINEFPGDESAGYNPVLPSAAERAYGAPNDFKRLVDALHNAGIAVLLDIVWNHVSSTDNVLWNYNGNQIYFDTPIQDTPWGAQADFDANPVRDLYLGSAELWLNEYRLDGFRMDATDFMNIGQHTASGWSLMQALNNLVDNRWADRVVIAEQLPDDSGVTQPTSNGGAGFDAQYFDRFTDDIRQEIQDAAFGDPEMWKIRDILNGAGVYLSGTRVVNYFELHDEAWPTSGGQRMVKTIDTTFPHDDVWAKGRTKLAQGIVLLAPGVPALLMGTEWLEDTAFGTSPAERIDWSKKTTYAGIYSYYKEVIGLRTSESSLRADAPVNVSHTDEGGNVIAFQRGFGDGSIMVVANFSNNTLNNYRIGLPTAGDWDVLVESQDPLYEGTGALNPATLSSQAVGWDGMAQSVTVNLAAVDLLVLRRSSTATTVGPHVGQSTGLWMAPAAPNPARGNTLIEYRLPGDGQIEITLHDLRGRRIRVLESSRRGAGSHLLRIDTTRLARGSYFVRLKSAGLALSQKLLVID